MKEFIFAALPWIIIGLAVAALCAGKIKRKKENEDAETYMTEGMCIGMCIGAALGSSGIVDLALGISLGMLIGEVAGMCIKK